MIIVNCRGPQGVAGAESSRLAAVILAFCLFVSLWGAPASGGENVTALIYHKFGEVKYPTTDVSLENFARQMAWLHDNNYQVLPLARLIELREKSAWLPERAVVITIDDGYESVYSGAWPILRKYGYPFTVFLYAKAVEKGYRDFLTWRQIDEMRAAGVDFQDHSYSHYRMGSKPAAIPDSGYGAWIRHDLEKSRAVFAHHFGRPPEFLALPYGEYNAVVVGQCRGLGYRAVFSQDPGSISSDSGYILPREPILGKDWSTMAHFKRVLERVDLPLANIYPDIAPFNGMTDKFCATLLYPERYDLRTLSVYVSELGWQSPKAAGSRVCLANDKELQRRSNRVAFRVREKNSKRYAVRFWLLLNSYEKLGTGK